ncbi:hypothetical protein IQ266_01435 [filamentous cyanobacterium LEGE 11480]|uniref:Uncharacterized protein n=2 Tax=Romeriopsis TaxID=2992131 RepID=A0A928VGY2_9CYAN|nr:hypothetical protein [Romeriopsis navalis LEGE 11480]
MDIIQTIAKVFGLSLGISLLIKYGLSRLTIPNDNTFALFLVILPTIIVAVWLGYKLRMPN